MLSGELEANPGRYSGLWSVKLAKDGAFVIVVGTTNDVESIKAAISDQYEYNLCVVEVPFSRVELDSAAARLEALDQGWTVTLDVPADRVRLELVRLTEDLANVLEPYESIISVDALISKGD